MDLFFDPEFTDSDPVLEKSESHHCIRVLRNKPGDPIQITDGKGNIWSGEINSFKNHRVKVEITAHQKQRRPKVERSLAVSVPKSSDRLEWIIEKGTELGMHSFYPLHSEFSERRKINPGRLLKKALSACKQSHNPYLPEINPINSFVDFISSTSSFQHKFICQQGANPEPLSILTGKVLFLVGPEGGFSTAEFSKAKEYGFGSLSLGKFILRTETAAIAALSLSFPQ